MPPRRVRLIEKLDGSRAERCAVAVSFYVDRIAIHDIIEVCACSISTVQREVLKAGYPLHRGRKRVTKARDLMPILAQARLEEPEGIVEWKEEYDLSDRTAAAIWYLARGGARIRFELEGCAIERRMTRRCPHCGGTTTERAVCPHCGKVM